ncbi:hypothetical protein [Thiocystis violacea]|uniref:hypothetical protein n=1 Tax=Thiocystis violacea TaxID=13725 RepID=UPI001908199D|nr:hypothetical protein [Thiocystis violacea]MBK1723140.1 hypothetical protein [Thiocystis violacea]
MTEAAHPTPGSPRALWLILAALVLGAIATLGYKLWPLLHPQVREVAELNPTCDLRRGPCAVRFSGGGSVSLEIRPGDIPTSAPLTLRVQVRDLDSERVEVDFAGVDMYMGFNRVELSRVEPGRYQGQGMIPVCVRARMTWEARVLIDTPDGLMAAPFRFESAR